MRYALCALFVLSTFGTANAGIVELDTSQSEFDSGTRNQGWWSRDADNENTEDVIITGTSNTIRYRSFYTFDLGMVAPAQTVDSASLTIQLGAVNTPGSTATIGFFEVDTDAATLNNNGIVGINLANSIYDDLGEGDLFGTRTFDTTTGPDTTLIFDLNPTAVAAIQERMTAFQNGLGDRYFSIGGSLQSSGVVFGGVDNAVKLTLNTTAVPEPSSLLVLGGIGCVAGLRRRRR